MQRQEQCQSSVRSRLYQRLLEINWLSHKTYIKTIGEKKATIKIVLADRITPQSRPLDALITAINELHLRITFEMVDTISNMQLADINSKPHGGKIQ